MLQSFAPIVMTTHFHWWTTGIPIYSWIFASIHCKDQTRNRGFAGFINQKDDCRTLTSGHQSEWRSVTPPKRILARDAKTYNRKSSYVSERALFHDGKCRRVNKSYSPPAPSRSSTAVHARFSSLRKEWGWKTEWERIVWPVRSEYSLWTGVSHSFWFCAKRLWSLRNAAASRKTRGEVSTFGKNKRAEWLSSACASKGELLMSSVNFSNLVNHESENNYSTHSNKWITYEMLAWQPFIRFRHVMRADAFSQSFSRVEVMMMGDEEVTRDSHREKVTGREWENVMGILMVMRTVMRKRDTSRSELISSERPDVHHHMSSLPLTPHLIPDHRIMMKGANPVFLSRDWLVSDLLEYSWHGILISLIIFHAIRQHHTHCHHWSHNSLILWSVNLIFVYLLPGFSFYWTEDRIERIEDLLMDADTDDDDDDHTRRPSVSWTILYQETSVSWIIIIIFLSRSLALLLSLSLSLHLSFSRSSLSLLSLSHSFSHFISLSLILSSSLNLPSPLSSSYS